MLIPSQNYLLSAKNRIVHSVYRHTHNNPTIKVKFSEQEEPNIDGIE